MTIPTISTGVYTLRRAPKPADSMRPAETPEQKQTRKAAGDVVAMAFYAPLLKQMRESPFKDELFSGGKGGQAFAKLLDQQMISRLGRGKDPVVDTVVKKYGGRGLPADALEAAAPEDLRGVQVSVAESKAGMLR